MLILNIETSTSVCSAALTDNGQAIRYHIDPDTHNHAKQLPLFIDDLLQWTKAEGRSLDAVALSQGPGSYTGLRIGTATAKGICYGLQIPLLAIDTLQIMAYSAARQANNGLLCPMIDARRMEVYCALYNQRAERLTETEAKVIDGESFRTALEKETIHFFGDGAAKCKAVIEHPNAVFIDNIVPDARQMGLLAEEAYKAGQFADIAYFSPYYLKEYQAAHSRNKVLQA